jgi:hypothetical protein
MLTTPSFSHWRISFTHIEAFKGNMYTAESGLRHPLLDLNRPDVSFTAESQSTIQELTDTNYPILRIYMFPT